MAAAGAIVGAVSSVSGIIGKSKQAKAQEAQIEAQRVGLRDQQTLNAASIAEQRRQIDAASTRERLLGLQAQALGTIQNEMQSKQQEIGLVQASIQNDQAEFLNIQRAQQKEAQANIAATEQLKQIQQLSNKGIQTTDRIDTEAGGMLSQRIANTGAGGMESQSNTMFLERVMNAIADSGIDTQSIFNSEMDDKDRQLLYETVVAGMEKRLGGVGIAQTDANIASGSRLNEIQRAGNAQNINNQTARNFNALDYETASKLGNLNLQLASNKSQTSSQLAGLDAQSSAIQRPGFADLLGAGANLGMSLYQSGIFGRGGGNTAPAPNAQPYSIMSGYNLSPFSGDTASGLLSGSGASAFGFSRGGI